MVFLPFSNASEKDDQHQTASGKAPGTPSKPYSKNNKGHVPLLKDFWTRQILLRCDSTGDLYPVTSLSYPQAFLVGQQTWHQRLGHPGSEVLRSLSITLMVLSRYMARLVAIGSINFAGIDVDETFSPVVKPVYSRLYTCSNLLVSGIRNIQIMFAFSRDLFIGLNRPLGPGFSDLRLLLLGLGFIIVAVTLHSSSTDRGQDTAYLILYFCDLVMLLGMFLSQTKMVLYFDSTLYRSLVEALQYLTFTRPNISYAVQQMIDWEGCLTYSVDSYTSGLCVFLGNNLLSCSSKRQFTSLSRASAEAEYRGVANAVAETCWLRNLLHELHTPLATAKLVYCDNVSVVYLSSNPVQHQRTKHIEIDIHFVWDLVATGVIPVLHVPSRYQYADIFTKGLPTSLFDEFRTSLSVRSSPALTTGGC
ncbi:ribonuclease H-like domain-containing protein [Tanacetum coccineum]